MGLKGRFGRSSARRSPSKRFAWGQRTWGVDPYSGSIGTGQVVTVTSVSGEATTVAAISPPADLGSRAQLLGIRGDLRLFLCAVGESQPVTTAIVPYVWLRRQIADGTVLSANLYSFMNTPGDQLAGRGDVMMYGTLVLNGFSNVTATPFTAGYEWGGNTFQSARIPLPKPRGMKLDNESSELVCMVSAPINPNNGAAIAATSSVVRCHNALRYLFGK